jgi:hypothetical protein
MCAHSHVLGILLGLCLSVWARSMDSMLEEAEDAAAVSLQQFTLPSGEVLDLATDKMSWAMAMQEVRFSEYGVDDEVLPSIAVGATEAVMMEVPSPQGMEVLRRKLLGGFLQLDVLQNQLAVISGGESREDRARRQAIRAGVENKLASELACHPINGTGDVCLSPPRSLMRMRLHRANLLPLHCGSTVHARQPQGCPWLALAA